MGDFGFNQDLVRSSKTEANEFLKSPYNQVKRRDILVEQDNGAPSNTAFKRIRAGTPMSKLSNGAYRPCNKSLANGPGAAQTTVTVKDTSVWYEGDPFFINDVDSGSVVASITDGTTFELDNPETWADQDVLDSGATSTCDGILLRDVSTVNDFDEDHEPIVRRTGGVLVLEAQVRESSLFGDPEAYKADLQGHIIFE